MNIKHALIAAGMAGSAYLGAAVTPNAPICAQRPSGLTADTTMVRGFSPDNANGTMTATFHDGSTVTYPFSWDRVAEFEKKVQDEVAKRKQ